MICLFVVPIMQLTNPAGDNLMQEHRHTVTINREEFDLLIQHYMTSQAFSNEQAKAQQERLEYFIKLRDSAFA